MESKSLVSRIKNQDGKLLSWTILIVSLVASAYLMGANDYLKASFRPEIAIMINVSIGVICFFMLGCAIHLSMEANSIKKGDPDFTEQLSRHNESMLKMIKENEILVNRIENKLAGNVIQLSARGMLHLNLAKRIINSLSERIYEIKKLLDRGTNKNLISADQLIRSKLIFTDNPMDAVFDSQSLPPLSMNDCKGVIERIVSELEAEAINKKAA